MNIYLSKYIGSRRKENHKVTEEEVPALSVLPEDAVFKPGEINFKDEKPAMWYQPS